MKHNTKFPLKGMGIVGGYGDGKIFVLGNLDKTKIKVKKIINSKKILCTLSTPTSKK